MSALLDPLVDGAPSLVVLVALGAVGVAGLARSRLDLTPLECFAYGLPAGVVTTSLAMLGIAVAVGRLSAPTVVGGAVASVVRRRRRIVADLEAA